MRAVWSFWTRPHQHARRGVWLSDRHHLLSWVLSVETARRHHPDTALVTDTAGARMLADGVGIDFGAVSTALDALDASDPEIWALGKLHAYAAQDRPFVHVDADVFLWNALPERLTRAAVFTQNPEPFEPGHPYYRPERLAAWLRAGGGWVPEEWSWFLQSGRQLRGDCCGIVGGRDVEFLRRYASMSIQTLEAPVNHAIWSRFADRQLDSLCLEQFYLAACVEHRGMTMEYLFSSIEESWAPGAATAAGYTHLISNAKSDPLLMQRLETRVARDYPEAYERVLRYLRDTAPGGVAAERAA